VFFKHEHTSGSEQLSQFFTCQKLFCETLARFCFFVRRVREDDLEFFIPGRAPEEIENALLSNARLEFCFGEVFLDDVG